MLKEGEQSEASQWLEQFARCAYWSVGPSVDYFCLSLPGQIFERTEIRGNSN